MKRLQLQRTLHLSDKGVCMLITFIEHIKIGFYIQLSDRPTTPLPYQIMSQHIDHGLEDKIAKK